jgi:hypothetical protein
MAIKLGRLTCDLAERPFVSDSNPLGASAYPFPLALVARTPADGECLSGLAIRLLHALIYLSWNLLDDEYVSPLMACGTPAIRSLVSNGLVTVRDLANAFHLLCTVEINLPIRDKPDTLGATTVLAWYEIDENGLARWQFSDAVIAWCVGAGATYAWMDVAVSRQIAHHSALRLYELGSAYRGRHHRLVRAGASDLRLFLEIGDAYRDLSDLHGKLLVRAAEELRACAPFTFTCKLERVITSKHRRFNLTVAPMPDWQPPSQLIAKPVSLEDLAFLSDLL